MLKVLTADDVIGIHQQIKPCALLDRGKLEAAVNQPLQAFGDTEFYPTIFEKASCLLRGLCHAHAFEDGNKRTAWISTQVFLGENGVRLVQVPPLEATDFVVSVTVGSVDLKESTIWLIDRTA